MEALLAGTTHCTNAMPAHQRLLLALVIVCALVLSHQSLSFVLYLVIGSYLWLRSPLGFIAGLKRLLIIDSLVLLTLLPLPFTYIDQQVIHLGGLTLSHAGLDKAQEILIKASLCLLVMLTQCSGLSGLELGRALARLKVPLKFIQLLQFSIRYISVMQRELTTLRSAMRARGFGRGSMLHNWRSYGYLFGMLLVRGLARADRIWLAMKCRGYSGEFPCTSQGGINEPLSKSALICAVLTLLVFIADISGGLAVAW